LRASLYLIYVADPEQMFVMAHPVSQAAKSFEGLGNGVSGSDLVWYGVGPCYR
jgi:hypothetical protein